MQGMGYRGKRNPTKRQDTAEDLKPIYEVQWHA